jgi:hypothetical protein
MYKWNGHYAESEPWNGWTVALLGGMVGMLLASAFWWLQSRAKPRPHQLKHLDLSRLGQAPARSHVQLSSHPARQERPR